MPRPKRLVQNESQKGEIIIDLNRVPWTALAPDRPELSGYTFSGADREQALTNAKAFLNRYYRSRGYWPITISIKDDDDSRA